MDSTFQWEPSVCLKFVTKQGGLTLSTKFKMDQFKKLSGQQMVLFALEPVEMAVLFLER